MELGGWLGKREREGRGKCKLMHNLVFRSVISKREENYKVPPQKWKERKRFSFY